MLFGKFLLDKKYINKSQFLESLKIYEEIIPSFLNIIISNNLLSEEQIVDLYEKVVTNSSSFFNEVNDEVKNKALEIQRKSVKSIAQLLYENGHISVSDLKKAALEFRALNNEESASSASSSDDGEVDSGISAAALESLKELQGDSFDMSEFETAQAVQEEPSSIVDNEGSDDTTVELSAAAIESLKELQGDSFDASILESNEEDNVKNVDVSEEKQAEVEQENISVEAIVDSIAEKPNKVDCHFAQVFSLKKYNKILKIKDMILKAANNDGEVSNYLNSLYKELHIVKGAAALEGTLKLSKMLDVWELIIDLLFKKDEKFLNEWANKYAASLEDTLDVAWEIREELNAGQTEDSIFTKDEIMKNYLSCITNLKNALKYIKEG